MPSAPPGYGQAPYGGGPTGAPTWQLVLGWIGAVVLPIVGIVIGYLITKNHPHQKGLGQAMMAVGAVFIFINFAIYS